MMEQKKYRQIRSILTIVILLLLPAYMLKQVWLPNHKKEINNAAEYVGKESCIECHQAEYYDWQGSDHDLAMDFANDSTVLGNFNHAILQRNNQSHKLYKKGQKYFAFTDGEDGKMKEYEIKYVFGYYPLQQYLVEFPGGRLQTLALTWNTKDKNWYYMADSVYKNMNIDHNNWLHWTNQAQNWNSMCADCHSTNLKKNYDIQTDSYHTTWSEIDVSCEACHGPASEHLKWANLADYARKDFTNYGLVIKTSGIDNQQYVDNCVRCHSRRTALSDFDPLAHNIYEHSNPANPSEPNWYIDGQIKEEDYVYASFTQSRMFMNDIKCNDCHNVHSGKLVIEGNALCLQCHKADDYDTKSHTFHKGYGEAGEAVVSSAGITFEVGSGSECINCHMHGQNFMGVDYRRDHSFRIPRPDLSEKNGTPNACNQCHTDKSNAWAKNHIIDWFGISRPFQYGQAFSMANRGDENADNRLRKMINDDLYPTNIRSIALGYLSPSLENDQIIKQYIQNLEPSLRISALSRFYIQTEDDLNDILPLLYDETKAVRLDAINKLSNIDPSLIPAKYLDAYEKALAEKLIILKYNADFPSGRYNLANFYYQQKDFEKAEQYYLDALEMDNELHIVKLNLAHLYSSIGQPIKAEKLLEEYVSDFPEDANALYNYGLILSENKKYQESLKYLLKASVLMPTNSRIDYNIAMMYDFFGNKKLVESYLIKAIKVDEKNISNYSNLLDFYRKNHYTEKEKALIKDIRIKFPQN